MKDLERLLNPEKRFLEYQDYIIDLISSSYHKNYKDLIATRIKNALYFFDSTPDIVYETLQKLDSNLDILKDYKYTLDEYNSKEEKLHKEMDDYILKYLKELLNISDDVISKNKDLFLGLRFEAFSKEYKEYLTSDDEELKSQVIELQEDYLDTCQRIGITPLLDENKIEQYLDFEKRQVIILEQNIIKNTIFGKKILERLDESMMVSFYNKTLIARNLVYFDEDRDATAITRLYRTKDFSKTLLSLPLLKNCFNKGLDIELIHELIHVSEMNNKMCSIVVSEDYRMFNEFRTQEKAWSLLDKLRKDNIYIFDQDNNDDTLYKSSYDYYLPLVNPLLNTYRELFDYSAINNRLSYIYKELGKENFNRYCIFLTNLFGNGLNINAVSDRDTISKNNYLIDKIKIYSKIPK